MLTDPRQLAMSVQQMHKINKTTVPRSRRVRIAVALRSRLNPEGLPFSAPQEARRRIDGTLTEATVDVEGPEGENDHGTGSTTESLVRRFANLKLSPSKPDKGKAVAKALPESQTLAGNLNDSTPAPQYRTKLDATTKEMYFPDVSYRHFCTSIKKDFQKEYQLVKNLTPGNQGRVDIFKFVPQNKLYVVKSISVRGKGTERKLPEEIFINRFHLPIHRNIVKRKDIFYDNEPQTFNIIMEYCSGGELFTFSKYWFEERKEKIPEMFMLHFIASMGEALGYIHLGLRHEEPADGVSMPGTVQDKKQLPLLHNDIKLENIFLRWDPANRFGMPDIVLGDFGGAMLEQQTQGAFGTEGYLAPEVQAFMKASGSKRRSMKPPMTRASDMYTVGACVGYLLLWGGFKQDMNVDAGFKDSSLKNWPLLLDSCRTCLSDDPEDRLPTEYFFDLAPMLTSHIQLLYDHGKRMPEGSWPRTADAPVEPKQVHDKARNVPPGNVAGPVEQKSTDSEHWSRVFAPVLGSDNAGQVAKAPLPEGNQDQTPIEPTIEPAEQAQNSLFAIPPGQRLRPGPITVSPMGTPKEGQEANSPPLSPRLYQLYKAFGIAK